MDHPEHTAQPSTQTLLAEFTALRAEIDRRSGVQWNVFALQVGSAGTIASFAIASESHIPLLLLIPLSSYMFGSRYVLHDYHIKLITSYIQTSLSERLNGDLQWPRWKADRLTVDKRRRARWYTKTVRWGPLHPTVLAFVGIAVVAQVGSAVAGIRLHMIESLSRWVVYGFTALWLLGLAAIAQLVLEFVQPSDARPASPLDGMAGPCDGGTTQARR